MEEITHYKVINNCNYKLIPTKDILLTEELKVTIKNNSKSEKPLRNNRRNRQRKCNRNINKVSGIGIQYMIDHFNNSFKLPPVLVKRVYNNEEDKYYYEILDGRHRVCTSHIFNYTHVPVMICNPGNKQSLYRIRNRVRNMGYKLSSHKEL